jgi:hypothetical protein
VAVDAEGEGSSSFAIGGSGFEVRAFGVRARTLATLERRTATFFLAASSIAILI